MGEIEEEVEEEDEKRVYETHIIFQLYARMSSAWRYKYYTSV